MYVIHNFLLLSLPAFLTLELNIRVPFMLIHFHFLSYSETIQCDLLHMLSFCGLIKSALPDSADVFKETHNLTAL